MLSLSSLALSLALFFSLLFDMSLCRLSLSSRLSRCLCLRSGGTRRRPRLGAFHHQERHGLRQASHQNQAQTSECLYDLFEFVLCSWLCLCSVALSACLVRLTFRLTYFCQSDLCASLLFRPCVSPQRCSAWGRSTTRMRSPPFKVGSFVHSQATHGRTRVLPASRCLRFIFLFPQSRALLLLSRRLS